MRRLLIANSETKHFEDLLNSVEYLEEVGDDSMGIYKKLGQISIILDPGEFVARWETCRICHGEGHNIFRRCAYCNNTGRVAVPVEETK